MVFKFTHTYENGKRPEFIPKSIKSVLTLDTIAEQSEIEEQPLMHQDETPLHQHSEPTPLEVEVVDQVEVKSTEDIIRDSDEEIIGLRKIFSIANSQITFLQQENFQLKVKLLLQSKPKPYLEADKGKGK